MIFDKLTKYYDNYYSHIPVAYEYKTIDILINLDINGNYKGLSYPDENFLYCAPAVKNRTRDKFPNLLVDDSIYVLNTSNKIDKEGADKQKLFRELIDECFAQTNNIYIKSVSNFLHNSIDKVKGDIKVKGDEKPIISFVVEEILPFEEKEVQNFWYTYLKAKSTSKFISQCSCCFKTTNLVNIMPIPYRRNGTPISLVSSNIASYKSYGLDFTCPICFDCAIKCTVALNTLSQDKKHITFFNDAAVIVWEKDLDEELIDIDEQINNPNVSTPEQFKKMTKLHSKVDASVFKPLYYYILGIDTSRKGSFAIKYFTPTSNEIIKKNIIEWFDLQDDKNKIIPNFVLSQSFFKKINDNVIKVSDKPKEKEIYKFLYEYAVLRKNIPDYIDNKLFNLIVSDIQLGKIFNEDFRTRLVMFKVLMKIRRKENIMEVQNSASFKLGRLFVEVSNAQKTSINSATNPVEQKIKWVMEYPQEGYISLMEDWVKVYKQTLLRKSKMSIHDAIDKAVDEIGFIQLKDRLNIEDKQDFIAGYIFEKNAIRDRIMNANSKKIQNEEKENDN